MCSIAGIIRHDILKIQNFRILRKILSHVPQIFLNCLHLGTEPRAASLNDTRECKFSPMLWYMLLQPSFGARFLPVNLASNPKTAVLDRVTGVQLPNHMFRLKKKLKISGSNSIYCPRHSKKSHLFISVHKS